jgi:hypothetical protein
MASGVEALAQGIADGLGVPALAKVGPNFRVQATTGPLGVIADVVSFAPPTGTGAWTVGAQRVTAVGLPVVTQASVGTTVMVSGNPGGPMQVTIPDSRVRAM